VSGTPSSAPDGDTAAEGAPGGAVSGRPVRAEAIVGGAERERGRRSGAGPGLAALALVALVAALAAGLPGRVHGGGGLSARSLVSDATAVVLVLALAGLVYVLYAEWLGRQPRARRARRRPRLPRPSWNPELLLAPLLLAAAAALLAGLVLLLGGGTRHPAPVPAGGAAVGLASPRAARAAGGAGGGVSVDPLVLILTAAVVVGVGAALAWRARRRRTPAADAGGADALVAAVDDSLEDLGSEPDPRRAVIKAYGRMERALAASGAARAGAETPVEYLRRALAAVRASQASIRRLTDLFEQARYSTHTIDGAMKQEAIAALTALRAELHGGGPA
jgi:hypothetical protein